MAVHASHAALPYPIKNARFSMLVPFLDADGDPTDPTTPDTEVSQDNGAFADAAEEVTTASGANGMGLITFTGAETNNSTVGVAFKAASGPKNTLATLYPRNLAIVGSGTLSAGSAGGGTLGTLLAYDVTGCFIRTMGGTGGGGTGGANNQARRIITYNTSSGAFTVSPNWETTPDATTTYDVLLPDGLTLGMLKTLNPATAGRALVVDSAGLADANTVKVGPTGSGAAQTARDLGASVLLSAGTGAGQLDFTSGVVKANVTQFGGTNGTNSGGRPEVNVSHWSGTVLAAADTAGYPKVTVKGGTGTGEISLSSGVVSADAVKVNGNASNAATLGLWLTGIAATGFDASDIGSSYGYFFSLNSVRALAADSGTTTTLVDAALTESATDYWKGAQVVFLSGSIAGQSRLVTGFNPATDTLTFSPATTAAVGTNIYLLISAGGRVDAVALSGDSVAADNAESFFDGTGYAGTNNVIPTVTAVGTLTTYAGNTPQTGDAYGRLGAPAGASVSADVAAVKTDTGNLVTRITSSLFSGITSLAQWLGLLAGKQTGNSTARTEIRATGAGSGTFDETTDSLEAVRDRGDLSWVTGTAAPTAAVVAAAVWDLSTTGHTTSGTFGAAVNAAGSAGDPWSTLLPGSYGAGTAGKIIGDNLNATVSSRSSHTAADVWAVGTRLLTAGTNIVLAKGTGVTGFNDLDASGVRTAVGLASANLDAQLAGVPAAVWAAGTRTITGGTVTAITGLTIGNVENAAGRFLGMIELNAGLYRYTVAALANAPAGGGGGGGVQKFITTENKEVRS